MNRRPSRMSNEVKTIDQPNSLWRGLMTLAALALLTGMAAGYQASMTPVTLIVDGTPRSLHTHQETVGALLLDLGLELYPEDLVIPSPDEPLQPNMAVYITHARPVLIHADGQAYLIRTHATSIDGILADAGLSMQPHDRINMEPVPASSEATLHLRLRRAVPVTLHEDGRQIELYTTATTVGGALRQAGLALYLADRVEPDLGQPLSAGMHIYIQRSLPVTVLVDGRTIRTRTHRDQVGPLLADLGIVLTGEDYTRPGPEAPLTADMTIEVVRVAERFLIQQQPIPFDIVWQPDPELEIDNQRLLQAGEPGVLEQRLRLRYENGQEVSRTVENAYVAVPPTTKIIGYGTQIVVRQLDTPQGPLEYWRVIRMLATSYSASTAGTSRSASWYGRTAGGCTMDNGIVAVSSMIPWKSYVYVPGYGIGYACDRGGAIHGRRIDLGYRDEDLVLWHRWVDVYLLTPVPPADQIDYILDY